MTCSLSTAQRIALVSSTKLIVKLIVAREKDSDQRTGTQLFANRTDFGKLFAATENFEKRAGLSFSLSETQSICSR